MAQSRSSILNSKLLGSDALASNLYWLDPHDVDNPNNSLDLSSWMTAAYITLCNITGLRWSTVVGILDYNNGDPIGRQIAIGTSGISQRRYVSGSWEDWTAI